MSSQLERLSALQSQIRECLEEISTAALQAHSEGSSWLEIGTALGISKQAAHKRFAPRKVPFEELPLSDPLFGPLFLTPQVATAPDGTMTTL